MDPLMNTEDGSYVVDDELFLSCSKDLKTKPVSQGKAGTAGPIVDCCACSLIGVLLRIRLQVSEESNNQKVQTLLGTTP